MGKLAPLSHQATKAVSSYLEGTRTRGNETIERRIGDAARIGEWMQERYGLENLSNLKSKHVEAFFRAKQGEGLSASTLANYATTARIIASAIGKENIVPRTNAELGFSRAGDRLNPIQADVTRLGEIRGELYQRGEWLGLAAEMREQFGLRNRESIMWSGNVVTRLDGTQAIQLTRQDGTKGGRVREVPIRTEAQRELVDRVRGYMQGNRGQLYPTSMTSKQAYNYQRDVLHRLGATKTAAANAHAARHAYAQERISQGADRQQVAEELGHGREDVVSHYVSR